MAELRVSGELRSRLAAVEDDLSTSSLQIRTLGAGLEVSELARLYAERALAEIHSTLARTEADYRAQIDSAFGNVLRLQAALERLGAQSRQKANELTSALALQAESAESAIQSSETTTRIHELETTLSQRDGQIRLLIERLDALETVAQSIGNANSTASPADCELIADPVAHAADPFSTDWKSYLPLMRAGEEGQQRQDGTIGSKTLKGGYLCYGPHVHLAPGTYALELDITRSAFGKVLPVSALLEVVDGHSLLGIKRLLLGAGLKTVELTFEIPLSNKRRNIEFRIIVGWLSLVTLNDVRLRQLTT